MNKIKLLIASIGVSGVLFFVSATGFGQIAVEPSYEVSLHLLMATNEAGQKGILPANLSAVSQQIKSNYGISNYRLVGTFLGRTANLGNFEAKSGLNIGPQVAGQPQSLLEWTVNNLKSGPTAKGGVAFQVQSLRVQARMPFSTVVAKDDAGKDRSNVVYENYGLVLSKVSFQENIPVLIGTLNLPGVSDTIFMVMSIKSTDL